MALTLGPRRGTYVDITEERRSGKTALTANRVKLLDDFDQIYRSLCALLFN